MYTTKRCQILTTKTTLSDISPFLHIQTKPYTIYNYGFNVRFTMIYDFEYTSALVQNLQFYI